MVCGCALVGGRVLVCGWAEGFVALALVWGSQ